MKTVFFPALFCFVLLAACEPDYVRSGDRFFMVELTNVSDSCALGGPVFYGRADKCVGFGHDG